MPAFWSVAALLIVTALAFVIVPLVRARVREGLSVRDANLAVLRGQRQEIETDVQLGLLPREARESALDELAARAEEDLAVKGETAGGGAPRPWVTIGLFALVLPVAAVALYRWVGAPQLLDPKLVAATAAAGDRHVEEMIGALAEKMKERPDDVKGWSLLARSYVAVGMTGKALEAFARLEKLAPEDANVLADYADTLALSQGRSLAGRPTELVMRALQADPRHMKALALAGTAKLNSGDFAQSLEYWERLYAVVPPGTEDAKGVQNIIEDVRARAAAAGKPQPPSSVLAAAPAAPRQAPAAAPAASAPGGKTVSGSVRIAAALAASAGPNDTLFIYARAESGPRIPLAIIRGAASELPKAFELDDSMGMTPQARLSTTARVVVEARVSRSGGATAQPGDLVGTSMPVEPGAKAVAIVIDKVVP